MRSSPAVSVIVTTYNRLRYLKNALARALRQTCPAREIIVCDGGSRDGSLEWLRERHPNLRIIALKDNPGPAVLMNRGLEAARGDLIAFLESDDQWSPYYLAEMTRGFSSSEALIRYCDYTEIDARDRVLKRVNRAQMPPNPPLVLEALGRETPVARALAGCTRLSFTLFQRAVFSRVGAFSTEFHWVCFDLDFTIRVARGFGSRAFSWLDQDLGFWRRHQEQLSSLIEGVKSRDEMRIQGREVDAIFDLIKLIRKYPPALKADMVKRLGREIRRDATAAAGAAA